MARILGLTATPQRGDGQPLNDLFGELVQGPSVRWLTAQNHLVPCDVYSLYSSSSALACDPVVAYQRHTPEGRAIVFCSTLEHCAAVIAGFEAVGVPAEILSGETKRDVRESMRERLASGALRALVGVGVFVEGFDLPAIDSVILGRQFGVTGTLLQAIGRGLRPSLATGKTRCTVLDLCGSVLLHGLPDEDRKWSIDGSPLRTEGLVALRRCDDCFALFRPERNCPRCGADTNAIRSIRRIETKDEKLERVSALSQEERERRYHETLFKVASERMRKNDNDALQWANKTFKKRFGRMPQSA